jgi:hypothetical protein
MTLRTARITAGSDMASVDNKAEIDRALLHSISYLELFKRKADADLVMQLLDSIGLGLSPR